MTALFTPLYDEPSGRYCGPTAICAVTGLPLSQVKAAIRQASGKITDAAGRSHRVSGVANKDLIGALTILGWHTIEQAECLNPGTRRDQFTFAEFCQARGNDGPYIVNVTGHYIAVGWGEMCDPSNEIGCDLKSYFAREWKRGKRSRHQNAWVHRWWKFAKNEPT